MTESFSRRRFLLGSLTAAVSTPLVKPARLIGQSQGAASRPVAISSANRATPLQGEPYFGGITATKKAIELIRAGADPLDAVIAGVNLVEDDPNDMTVGYGGLPNEEGEVELDAAVFHGPTGRAGAVAGLKWIKNPSKIAKLIMENTDHVLLQGDGALRFALAYGFKKEDLVTDRSRAAWLQWREQRSDRDHWIESKVTSKKETSALFPRDHDWSQYTGSIATLAINEAGDISGVTTTSGLAFKVPGRVGDLAVIGAGLYVDNDVGGAGSTGWGEDNIRVVGAHTVVEAMRRGAKPVEACLEALRRVSKIYGGKPTHQLNFYAINKNGEYGGAAMFKGPVFAVTDSRGSRTEESTSLFDRPPR
jgi:N4-(beta-N-acetylglucosaminyl)-L-asparaginase